MTGIDLITLRIIPDISRYSINCFNQDAPLPLQKRVLELAVRERKENHYYFSQFHVKFIFYSCLSVHYIIMEELYE